MPFRKYCRRRPLVFSFEPRCQGLCSMERQSKAATFFVSRTRRLVEMRPRLSGFSLPGPIHDWNTQWEKLDLTINPTSLLTFSFANHQLSNPIKCLCCGLFWTVIRTNAWHGLPRFATKRTRRWSKRNTKRVACIGKVREEKVGSFATVRHYKGCKVRRSS